jgi:hypothetical protein
MNGALRGTAVAGAVAYGVLFRLGAMWGATPVEGRMCFRVTNSCTARRC